MDRSVLKKSNALLAYYPRNGPIANQLPFHLWSIGDFYCDDDYCTERSGLDWMLLLYTLQGTGEIRYRQCAATIGVGQLAVINCAHYQYYAPAQGTRWRFRWMHFRGNCADTMARLINGDGLHVVDVDAFGVIDNSFDRIFTLLQRESSGVEHLLSADLHSILSVMAEQATPKEGTAQTLSPAVRQMQEMEDYLRSNFTEKLSLDALARKCHLSKFYFIKVFSANAGCTPYEYLLRVRIRESKRLLAQTAMPVSEVAAVVGFSDVKSFIAHFQKREGLSPGLFRKQFIFHTLG